MSQALDRPNQNDNTSLVRRYEKMSRENKVVYFDVHEIEQIIDFYIKENKLSDGLKVCNMGIRIHPKSSDLLQKKAYLLIELKAPGEALKILKKISASEPYNSENKILKGITYSYLGEVNKSIKCFNQALSLIDDEEEQMYVLHDIGMVFMKIGRYDLSVKYLEDAHALYPKDEEVMYDLAFCYDRTNETSKSINLYEKILEKDPFSDLAWYNIGVCYDRQNRLQKALEAYEYSLALNDNYVSAMLNKANVLHSLNRRHDAILVLTQAIEYEPENEDIFFLLGRTQYEEGLLEESLISLKSAAAINSHFADVWYYIGLIAYDLGEYKKCKTLIERAIEIDENNASYWFVLAKTNINLHEYGKAEKNYQQTINLEPFSKNIWIDYFDFKFSFGKLNEAKEVLLQAEEHISTSYEINARLSAIYLLLNQKDKSYELLKKALDKNLNSKNIFKMYYSEKINYNAILELLK